MQIYEAMERAIGNAPYVEHIPVLNDMFPTKPPQGEGDDAVVNLNPVFLPDRPNQISIDAMGSLGFRELFQVFTEVSGGYSYKPEYVDYTVEHERDHVEAGRLLGAEAARFGLHIYHSRWYGESFRLTVQPYSVVQVRTNRLGAALISAYPDSPSMSDYQKVVEYGYPSVEDLARRAMERNRLKKDPREPFYPVPRGFDQS